MINNVTIAGNLARDIDLRTTASGFAIGLLRVAVNDRRKDKETGEYKDVPSFFTAKLLGRRAEKLSPYLTKGTKVFINGKLEEDSWQDKEGNRRSVVNIVIDDFDFISLRKSKGEDAPAAKDANEAASAPTIGGMPIVTAQSAETVQPEADGAPTDDDAAMQEAVTMIGSAPVAIAQAPAPVYAQQEFIDESPADEPIELVAELIEESAAYTDDEVTEIDYRVIPGWEQY